MSVKNFSIGDNGCATPCFNMSTNGMNDQFASAWECPNLEVVQVEILEEEVEFLGYEKEIVNFANELRDYLKYGKEGKPREEDCNQLRRPETESLEAKEYNRDDISGRDDQPETGHVIRPDRTINNRYSALDYHKRTLEEINKLMEDGTNKEFIELDRT